METNLVDLMSKVSQLEREFNDLGYELRSNSINIKTIELDGKEQILEEYPDFINDFLRYEFLSSEITRLKGIIFERNNSLKLKNGDTIQKALTYIQNKRKMLDLVKYLARQNSSKKRNTEVNNSYFSSKELAYDKEEMKRLEKDIIKEIQDIEFEISNLNSQVFTI